MQSHTATLNGQEFFIRTWGDASLPKMLLLHGFPEYGGAWEDLATRLAPYFHCIAPDQRGFGRSWAPDDVSSYALSKLVSDMAALIGEDGPITVLGHDWGASVGYGLAMFRPELVERLIIMNGVHPVPFQRALAAGGPQAAASQYINFLRRDRSEDRLAADDFAILRKMLFSGENTSWLSEDRIAAYTQEWGRPGKLRTMVHWYRASPLVVADPGKPVDMPDLPVDQLMVRCPHLLVWGNADAALLPVATEGLEEFAPDLTRVEIEGCDHWLYHQKPDEVAAAVLGWLGKT